MSRGDPQNVDMRPSSILGLSIISAVSFSPRSKLRLHLRECFSVISTSEGACLAAKSKQIRSLSMSRHVTSSLIPLRQYDTTRACQHGTHLRTCTPCKILYVFKTTFLFLSLSVNSLSYCMLEWTSWWGMGAENRHVVSSTLLLDVIKVVKL
jgi:hypothetical protein